MKKYHLLTLLTLFVFSGSLIAKQIELGDPEVDVRNIMGKPSGLITIGTNERVLSYPQGDVTITDGKVSKIDFLPGGKTYADISRKSEVMLQERISFDQTLFNKPLNEFMDSEGYKALTNSQKIAKLKEFKDENPTVDITSAVEMLEKDMAEEKQTQGSVKPPKETVIAPEPPEIPEASPPVAGDGSTFGGGYKSQNADFYKIPDPPKKEDESKE